MRIYLAHSPYHVLLAYNSAYDLNNNDSRLFVSPTFKHHNKMLESLDNCSDCPFSDIIYLGSTYDKKTTERRLLKAKRSWKMALYTWLADVDEVYVFNDTSADSQAALSISKLKGAENIYVEDGMAIYNSQVKRSRKKPKVIYKLYYGPWWKDVHIQGTSKWIDKVAAVYPQFVRPEIDAKKETISLNVDFKEIEWVIDYFNRLGINHNVVQNLDVIIVLDYIGSSTDGLGQKINSMLKALLNTGYSVGIKYHPKESKSDPLHISNKDNVRIFPRGIPIELLYIVGRESLKIVLGGISTSMITAKWLLPDAKVMSFIPINQIEDENIRSLYKKLNINDSIAFN